MKQNNPFHSLIISQCNKTQIEAAMLYSERRFVDTPLYIHGGIGHGKTTLLKATYNAFGIYYPDCTGIFLEAPELIRMIRESEVAKELDTFVHYFSLKYQFIALDSFAYFCGDESLQRILHDIINPKNSKPPIFALTSQRHFDNHVLIPELQEYFEKAMVISLLPFDYDFKEAAFTAKVQEYSLGLSRETIRALSLVVGDSGHEIEDSIRKICMQ